MSGLLNPFISFPPSGGGGGGPGPFSFDFVAGTYTVNGVTVTAADVIDQPGWIDGTGLVIADSAATVGVLGDALTYLLAADWTVVIEWDHFVTNNTIQPLVLSDGSLDNVVRLRRQNSLSSRFMNVSDFAGVNFRQATDASASIGDGQHKIALTRTNSKLAFSIDGQSVVSNTSTTFSITPTGAAFGGYPGDMIGDALTIKSCVVTAPVSDASLPTLST